MSRTAPVLKSQRPAVALWGFSVAMVKCASITPRTVATLITVAQTVPVFAYQAVRATMIAPTETGADPLKIMGHADVCLLPPKVISVMAMYWPGRESAAIPT